MEKLFVGQPVPSSWAIPKWFSGSRLEVSPDSFYIILGFPRMDEKEKEALRTGKIYFRVIEEDGMLLSLIRFGSSPPIFELPFDPTRYADDRVEKLRGAVNTLQIIGIDTLPMTIQVLRFVSIPKRLLDRWYGNWELAVLDQGFSARYSIWLNHLFSQYDTIQLWGQGIYIGNLGEV